MRLPTRAVRACASAMNPRTSKSTRTWPCDRESARRWTKSTPIGATLDQLEQSKARIRAKVERLFRAIERPFGQLKVRYRGLAKNTAQLHTLFALSNMWMVPRFIAAGMRARMRLKAAKGPSDGTKLPLEYAQMSPDRHHLKSRISTLAPEGVVQTILGVCGAKRTPIILYSTAF